VHALKIDQTKTIHMACKHIPPCVQWVFPLTESFHVHCCTAIDNLHVQHIQTISVNHS